MGKIPEIIETEEKSSEFEKNQEEIVKQTKQFLSAGRGGKYFAEESGFRSQDLWMQDIDPAM